MVYIVWIPNQLLVRYFRHDDVIKWKHIFRVTGHFDLHTWTGHHNVRDPGVAMTGRCLSMMTSSNGNIFRVTGSLCAGNSPVTGEFPAQRPVTRSFDVFFDLRLITRLSKQSRGWWFETPSRPLWCHCNGIEIYSVSHDIACCFVVVGFVAAI